jgi:putative DNA primase/helicase
MNGLNIPQTMKDRPAWVCWKLQERDGRPTKIPINPLTGGNAMSTEPSTWGTYVKAITGKAKYNTDGIGFCFGDGFVGVDIDHCIDTATGEVSELAKSIVELLDSYTEQSPSGTGIHIICKGCLPPGGRKNTALGLEMYSEGRFFTVTTDRTHGVEVEERTEQLAQLHAMHMKPEKPPQERREPAQSVGIESDDVLLDKAGKASNGTLFKQLYGGVKRGYPSQSEADMALCNLLAFWCNGDPIAMDRLFRRSGLMRDKWDNPSNGKSGSTYGQDTIEKAIYGMSGEGYHAPTGRANDWIPNPSEDPTEAAPDEEATEGEPEEQAAEGLTDAELFDGVPAGAAYFTVPHNYPCNDTGNAARFGDLYGLDIRFLHENNYWLVWDGKVWRPDAQDSIKLRADRTIEIVKHEKFAAPDIYRRADLEKNAKKISSSAGKEAMLKETRHLYPIANADMDINPFLFNLANGTYDLEAQQLLPHARENYITYISDVAYDANAPEPVRWKQFLSEIMCGDEDMVRFLQKAVGYSMSGSTKEQCFFILYGFGANGKSTFIDAVTSVMGNYVTTSRSETLMSKNNASGSSATPDIAQLRGRRMTITSETKEADKLSEALIKEMTGGEKMICRELFGKLFTFKPEFKIWLVTNHRPVIKGVDEGIWRRIMLIPFTATFTEGKRDKDLPAKLEAERAGILNWALEGYSMWKAEGLRPPEAVAEATKEYRDDMDIVSSFINEKCKRVGSCSIANLYAEFKAWAEENGERVMTAKRLAMQLKEKGIEKRRVSTGMVYDGIGMVNPRNFNRGVMNYDDEGYA